MQELIVTLGLLLGGATLLAVVLKFLKQSSIIAFIGMGMLAGLFRENFVLPQELLAAFTEIGIIMLLFMAGLEVDLRNFIKRWRLVVVNGVGQVVLVTLLGLTLGFNYVGITELVPLVYFALCLTLSSTIMVLDALKEKKAMDSLHGQVVLGLMVIQDITAVLALSVLKSYGSDAPLAQEILLILGKMAVLVLVLAVLERYVLAAVFRHLARSAEMLFIGTLGYCMGVAAICEAFHFSPEIGAFFAGASLGFIPYRLEIEDKVEPLKTFGVILFFISLGYSLELTPQMVGLLDSVVVLTLFVVLGTPAIMILLGWLTRLRSRPAFLIGGIINQISEFSLILATLCRQSGIFDERLFTLITLTCLGTFVLSSFGHQYLHNCYDVLHHLLKFVDRRSIPYQIQAHSDFKFEDHVVVLSFNEISHEIAELCRERGERILLIDIDPDIIEHFDTNREHNVVPLYADIYDPDVWEEFGFAKARIIISCMIRDQQAELAIARWLKENAPEVPFVATTDSYEETLELYQSGVRYVIQTEYLAAVGFRPVFAEEIVKGREAFREAGRKHQEDLRELESRMDAVFRLI